MKIELIQDIEQMKLYQKNWNHCVENSNYDSLFVTFEWFFAWGQAFCKDKNLFLVLAHDESTVLGFMPFHLETYHCFGSNFKILKSMTNLESPRFNLVYKNQAVLEAMLSFLKSNLHWDLIQLDYVPTHDNLFSTLQKFKGSYFFNLLSQVSRLSACVKINGKWSDYLKQRHSKFQKNLNYYEDRLHHHGQYNLNTASTGDLLGQQLNDAFVIEKKSWKGLIGTSILDTPGYQSFYTKLAVAMSAEDRFELNLLVLDGEKIAFDYCLKYKKYFFVLKTSYNSAYKKFSPGRILKKKVLQRLFLEGRYETYDLLGAYDPWKKEWANDVESLSTVFIFSNTTLSKLLYYYYAVKNQIKKTLRPLVQLLRK